MAKKRSQGNGRSASNVVKFSNRLPRYNIDVIDTVDGMVRIEARIPFEVYEALMNTLKLL